MSIKINGRNEEGVLVSLREMENSDDNEHFEEDQDKSIENDHHYNTIIRQQQLHHSSYTHKSLPWLDLRVFYVRITKCVIDDESTPEYLTLNHVPLNRDTLLEVNGAKTGIYSDGVSTLLKRDRFDKKSEEVTFVSTDSIKTSGSVRFEVFRKDDVLVLWGTLELLCHHGNNGFQGPVWVMNCGSDVYMKGNCTNQLMKESTSSPSIEVYVAGRCLSAPIVLSKSLQLSNRRKQARKCVLESIPECAVTEDNDRGGASSSLALQSRKYSLSIYKLQEERHVISYPSFEYLEGEDGELSWFNAGVRVGVGLGFSLCLGVGIGVGLLVRTYQGTARPFRSRLL